MNYKEKLRNIKYFYDWLKDKEKIFKSENDKESSELIASIKSMYEDVFDIEQESEDERIRETLVELVKCNERSGYKLLNNIPTSSMLAWLEKQGEQKETLCDKCKKAQPSHSCQDITALGRCYIEGMNTSNKIEPKFKVGDWITDGYLHCKISDVLDDRYIVDTKFAKRSAISFKYENNYHLWTIQDAKDGDVIFYDSGWTCIFKYIHGIWYSSYCFITADGEFHKGYEEHAVDAKINGNANPATKEQHDLLFEKLHEAEYEWDAEKKELRKIEQNLLEVKEVDLELENENNNPKITRGTKIRSKTNPNEILIIMSDDCHEDEFECTNGSVLSLKQIEKYYDIYIEEK